MHLSARSLFGTILVLSAIQVVSSSSAASGRVGGAFQGLGTVARYLMSPSVPLIPDRRKPHTATASTSTAATVQQTAFSLPSLPPIQG
jgi:hypothetical protein